MGYPPSPFEREGTPTCRITRRSTSCRCVWTTPRSFLNGSDTDLKKDQKMQQEELAKMLSEASGQRRKHPTTFSAHEADGNKGI
jgi:hypothetical protein